ncbi:hypothetical protein [Winogradskyella flava]|uniref:Uncharacterized protein n=1 Tax=Winogradskyella flava TaxID=1884876 RepID=A0A842IJW5_9FLAO|nr:hypothetical protein [Winogradskyella flava]MBC2843582.1 hypothetical protein [Winogradskyella flava]
MRNNILGGLVIFFVVVTCLLMIDDISNTKEEQIQYQNVETLDQQEEQQTDLAVLDEDEE